MAGALSIGSAIVSLLHLAGKVATKANDITGSPPHIRQVFTEAEAFKGLVILLQGLLLDRSEMALDCQKLIHVSSVIRTLEACMTTFGSLEEELAGLMKE